MPEEWATADDISLFDAKITTDEDFGGSKIIRTDASGDLVLLGGPDGAAGIYSLSQKRRVKTFEVSKGSVVDAIWWDGQAICGLSTGAIKIFKDDGTSTDLGTHSGSVAALSLHPCGDILSSVGQDKGYMLYDLQLMKLVNRVYIESGKLIYSSNLNIKLLMLFARTYLWTLSSRRAPLCGWMRGWRDQAFRPQKRR